MIQILEENEFYFILDKPPGVTIHNEEPSLKTYLLNKKLPIHFVNRLDSDTSGLVIVAKSPQVHTELTQALHSGKKIYRALLRGQLKNKPLIGHWSWPISDKSEGRRNPQGLTKDRVAAQTDYQVLKNNSFFIEVSCTLHTGRQHQIRKHSALFGHAIVGDARYNEPKYNLMISERYKTDRLCLHAEKIEFTFRGQNVSYTSPISFDLFFTST